MTRICFLSDTHGNHRRVTAPDCDLIVFCGDFSNYGELDVLSDFNDWLAWRGIPAVGIAGNHDMTLEREPLIGAEFLTNITLLNNTIVETLGLKIWGSPMSKRIGHWAFQYEWYNGETIWESIPQEPVDIIVTHGPPASILDRVYGGQRVGCQALHKAICAAKPKIHAFGHIHEDPGVFRTFDTLFVNCSIWNHVTGQLNKPVLVDYEGVVPRLVNATQY